MLRKQIGKSNIQKKQDTKNQEELFIISHIKWAF